MSEPNGTGGAGLTWAWRHPRAGVSPGPLLKTCLPIPAPLPLDLGRTLCPVPPLRAVALADCVSATSGPDTQGLDGGPAEAAALAVGQTLPAAWSDLCCGFSASWQTPLPCVCVLRICPCAWSCARLHVYICVCEYMFVYLDACVCLCAVYVSLCVCHMHVSMSVFGMCLCICVHGYMCVCPCVCHMHLSMSAFVYVNICVCVRGYMSLCVMCVHSPWGTTAPLL